MNKSKVNSSHIGIFGKTNSGKSSLINALSGQSLAIVSEIPGTTTDPVKKSIEILGLGPVILIDTAGIDDTSELGKLRITKSLEQLDIVDIALIVISENNFDKYESSLIDELKKRNTPFILVYNKTDLVKPELDLIDKIWTVYQKDIIPVSTFDNNSIELLNKELIRLQSEISDNKISLFSGIIEKGDYVLLVTPIDSEAPEGRMILPQVNAIRDILDNNGIALVLRETEIEKFFQDGKIVPKIVVTDSQAFGYVNKIVPKEIFLTGFSILMARIKGNFEEYIKGTPKISELKNGDSVLLLESCTHTTSCEDIGRFKIPNWLREFTGKNLNFDVVSGLDRLPKPIDNYSLIIQCGGCVVTRKQITNRLRTAKEKEIPLTNYGMTIAYLHNIFDRAIEPFIKLNLKTY